ncbi:NAD(P)H-binding protein [Rhodocytophaga rosea]|uniref:NAD(P)H-binding protein n=1 Tax=Rhodocytophaga rosea TaxID=2704465 RepID=A0A6C0GH76_9BACT|nr:NAD(P)H-binding protein [Rhodocytophaga rosea]QHT67289.1 NAD(P)H-binding protein [Rhodocytophaga rosea]
MKIVVTGSLGNISKPLTIELVKKGHVVTVISSNAEKKKEIETLGATAAIGSLEDVDFITTTFTGHEAVYSMIPPNNYFDHYLDLAAYYERLGKNYAQAINQSAVKRQVHLSSIGAHLQKGNGILASTYVVEHILNQSTDVAVTFIRPTSFYYNLLGYIHGIKTAGAVCANYGTENIIPWVSPIDIAAVVAEELTTPTGTHVRYVASEELKGNDTAKILGAAIGKPDLQWKLISNEESLNGLLAIGMNPAIAAGLVEMYAALQTGLLSEDYFRNKSEKMGNVKLVDYAKEFASIYNG